MSDEELRDALERLAGRGTPRGFDEVIGGAAEEASREAGAPIPFGWATEAADLEPIPFVSAEPSLRRRRRPLGSMIAAAGVAALVVVGTFAVSAVVGNGGSGSSSPEGAVERLADALRHEDPLAAADVLAPDEVRSLHATVDTAERKAADLRLVQSAAAPLAGINFDVTGLQLSTKSLGDGFAKVTVDTGTFAASTHKSQFSPVMQKVLRNSSDNSTSADLSRLASNINLPTFLVAVRNGGKWYISAAYTMLEYVREDNQLPAADFGSGERAASTLGADSPDAAVQESMRALQQRDWAKLISMAPPGELPVYDYRKALTALADKRSPRTRAQSTFSITSMTTASSVDGDTAKVDLRASGTTQNGTWSLDGGCYSVTDGSDSAGGAFPCGESLLFASPLTFAFGSVDTQTQITVVKQDGRWFVSPVGTVLDLVNRAIDQLDRRWLYTVLNIPDALPADGPLTLGTPVGLSGTKSQAIRVLTLDGTKGESLLGLATSGASSSTGPGNYSNPGYDPVVRVFAPDGSELGAAAGLIHGSALTLPTDGTYTVVLEAFTFIRSTSNTVTVTIWRAADAPAAAKSASNGESCTYTIAGSACSSSISSPTVRIGVGPIVGGSSSGSSPSAGVSPTIPTGSNSGTTGPSIGNGETCTSTANSMSCSGSSMPTPTTAAGG